MGAPASQDIDALLAQLDQLVAPPSPRPTVREPEPAQAAAPAPVPPPAPGPAKAQHILIVEDSKDYREVITFLLSESGYRVTTACDGREGLARARELRPDLVLLDFNMPELNGYEVIQELRSSDDTRKVPIILFTGAPNRRALREMRLDIDGFLEKPVSNAQLLTEVERVLGPDRTRWKGPAPEKDFVPELAPVTIDPGAAHSPPPPPAPAAPVRPSEPRKKAVEMPSLEDLERESLEDSQELLVDIEHGGDDAQAEAGLETAANDSPLVNRVNKILVRAVELGASDIHIEPQ
ncbi:MAG: response regulator [Elusimicrobia bacterium]|nr:response regulator [Elusimicrobiota bacterium]